MELNAEQLRLNYLSIRERIEKACSRTQRKDRPLLIAVSKTKPVWMIETLYEMGLRDFGENYAQELQNKKKQLNQYGDLRFHFIGHLQKNKVKALLQSTRTIHSVDSLSLLIEIEKRMKQEANPQMAEVFLQVNPDEESSKGGFLFSQLPQSLDQIRAHRFSHIQFQGWMCIPDPSRDPRRAFERLSELRVDHPDFGGGLSMGMSDDFELATELGSTHLRVGSSLFGAR